MPARINSVFLVGAASLAVRSFSVSSTANSGFGMVKLSRTIFIFFALGDFSAAGWLAGLLGGRALTVLFPGALDDFAGGVAMVGLGALAGAFVTDLAVVPGARGAGLVLDALDAMVLMNGSFC